MGLFNRKKYIKPPFQRTKDDFPFTIFHILTEDEKRVYKKNRFVSPIFGRHVKDEVVVPIMENIKKDMEKLDPFRIKPKLTNEERIKKYGTAYPEFDVISGKNLYEALENQDQKRPYHPKETELPIQEDFPVDNFQEETFTLNHEHDSFEDSNPKEASSFNEESNDSQNTFEDSLELEDETLEENQEPDLITQSIEEKKEVPPKKVKKAYVLPSINLFKIPSQQSLDPTESLERQQGLINQTFESFGVAAHVHAYTNGPTVTRFEVILESGVRISKVTQLQDNLKMNLSAEQIRIEAPIPGKSTVGIEVPNEIRRTVHFYDLIKQPEFKNADEPLAVALGQDIDGFTIVESIKAMPHGLIAGQTGSGKSVNINTILVSLLLKYTPDELKMILIDPKMVELTSYDDLPHLLTPVITNVKAATAALKWAVDEMERRYQMFSDSRVRDMISYNEVAHESLPYIVIVVDELADLMVVASQAVEESIMRITQKARAAGIHLLVATQRPSTDVIKGTIKSNIPTRIAFSVASHIDSQTILDSAGAEKLIGKGDMLLLANGKNKRRLQGAYVSDEDIFAVTDFIKAQGEPDYLFTADELIEKAMNTFQNDDLLVDVAKFIIDQGEASMNRIIKSFGIGFNRAQSIVNSLESAGILSENLGTKPRTVLVGEEEAEEIIERLRGI
jgi:S-DNA-T family DNA segregation ATPase FtsK/SpoIIIE